MSSSRRGATGQLPMPSGVLLGSSPWYQTFHSSNEMYTSCVLFRWAFVAAMVAATSLMKPSISTPEARKLAMSRVPSSLKNGW